MKDTDQSPPLSRRAMLVVGAATVPLIAGCGDDRDTDVTAIVGERASDDVISLVVESVERTGVLGEYEEAGPENEFVVVTVAVKNETDDGYVDFNSFLQTRLHDAEAYDYEPKQVGTGRPLEGHQLAPGELSRGDIVYEVPEDAAGLVLKVDLSSNDRSGVDGIHVDLTERDGTVVALEQDLHVDVHQTGDTVADGELEVTLKAVRAETTLADFLDADEGNEYVVVDASVTNESGGATPVSIASQMVLKDGDGWMYLVDVRAHSTLDRAFVQRPQLGDGETRRGEIAYRVPAGVDPLYWAFEFDLLADGTKTFWQLR